MCCTDFDPSLLSIVRHGQRCWVLVLGSPKFSMIKRKLPDSQLLGRSQRP